MGTQGTMIEKIRRCEERVREFPTAKLGEKVMTRTQKSGVVDLDLPFQLPRCWQSPEAPVRLGVGLFLYPYHNSVQCRTTGTLHPHSVCYQEAARQGGICRAHANIMS